MQNTYAITKASVVLTVAMGLLIGCADGFQPASLINGMRTIALVADPPWLAPAPDQSTRLSALVVGVRADTAVCHGWTACVFATQQDGRLACFDPRLEVPLGTAASVTVDGAHLSELLAGAAEVQAERPELAGFDAAGGDSAAPASLSLTILHGVAERALFGGVCPSDARTLLQAECGDPDRCRVSRRSLTVALSPADQHSNPSLTAMAVGDLGAVEAPVAAIKTTGAGLNLAPQWAADSLETWLDQGVSRTESLLFSWYATAGSFDSERSWDEVPQTSWSRDGAKSGPVEVWVVARDGRGGVAWRSGQTAVAIANYPSKSAWAASRSNASGRQSPTQSASSSESSR